MLAATAAAALTHVVALVAGADMLVPVFDGNGTEQLATVGVAGSAAAATLLGWAVAWTAARLAYRRRQEWLIRPPAIARVGPTVNAFIDVAAAGGGVVHIVVSSVAGADTNRIVPHHRIETHLARSGIAWTMLRPGFYAQNLATAYRTDIRDHDRIYLPAGDGKVAFTDTRDLGQLATTTLTDPAEHAGQGYTLTGPRAVTFTEEAALLTGTLGRPFATSATTAPTMSTCGSAQKTTPDRRCQVILAGGRPEPASTLRDRRPEVTATIPDATFEGFPAAAFAFYAELEEPGNNSKAWFDANRTRYDRDVRRPIEALLAAAADEFGTHAKVFRPNRDVRFSPDKRPYKTSIAALITLGGIDGAPGYYVALDADGVFVGTGYHEFSRDQLQDYRRAVEDDRSGPELATLVEAARHRGIEVGGRTLTRGPRGVDPDHPRLELLCHTAMTLMRHYPEHEAMYTPAAADLVFDTWRDGTDIAHWLTRHLAGTTPDR